MEGGGRRRKSAVDFERTLWSIRRHSLFDAADKLEELSARLGELSALARRADMGKVPMGAGYVLAVEADAMVERAEELIQAAGWALEGFGNPNGSGANVERDVE